MHKFKVADYKIIQNCYLLTRSSGFQKIPCFLWHSPRFIGDVVETIVELGRYNETIGCHYKLADQRRQSCQERQKLGAAANNCNRCIFTEYSVFFVLFF